MNNLFVYTFYRFKNLKNIDQHKSIFDKYLLNRNIKGTILIANEGINGSISGSRRRLDEFIKFLKSYLNIRKLDIKINQTEFYPFNRMKVRLKKEIVSLGQGEIDVNKYRGRLVEPEHWDKITSDKNTTIIDVRNEFEIKIGKFVNSINPKTKNFSEFPKVFKEMKINKEDAIAMYCTGGIRCEKASAFLKKRGYKNIFQLKGGIINYLKLKNEKKQKTKWVGECFVFDDRVTINKNLLRGKYIQCYGCRRPLTKKDVRSNAYRKGIHCPYCVNERSTKQIRSSESRQAQINISEKRSIYHTVKKIKNLA